jgi:AcrR family transcriptional regulator
MSIARANSGASKRARHTRADGERSRRAILDAAAELATVAGLHGLSIGRLADHVGMSKSGLYAHFRSKEQLQLAAIETAQEIFGREVLEPGLKSPSGVARVQGLCDSFLSYVERRVFPGGCFFASAAAELDTHEGRVAQRIRDSYAEWLELLTDAIGEAQSLGELDSGEEPRQLSFELDSLLLGANALFVLFHDNDAPERAQRAIRRRLEVAAPVRN